MKGNCDSISFSKEVMEKTRCLSQQGSEQLSNSLLGGEMGREQSSQIPFTEVQFVFRLPATNPSFAHHVSDVFYDPPSSSWPGAEQGALQQRAKPERLLPVVPQGMGCHRLRENSWGCTDVAACRLECCFTRCSFIVLCR